MSRDRIVPAFGCPSPLGTRLLLMTWKRLGGHGRKLPCIFPAVERRQVSFFTVWRVSQASVTPSASRVGTCLDGPWKSGQGPSLGRAPRRASRGGLAVGSWHSAALGRPCFDGWPGSLCYTDHPPVAEVVKCVPVNSTPGSELKREQSPRNGP